VTQSIEKHAPKAWDQRPTETVAEFQQFQRWLTSVKDGQRPSPDTFDVSAETVHEHRWHDRAMSYDIKSMGGASVANLLAAGASNAAALFFRESAMCLAASARSSSPTLSSKELVSLMVAMTKMHQVNAEIQLARAAAEEAKAEQTKPLTPEQARFCLKHREMLESIGLVTDVKEDQ